MRRFIFELRVWLASKLVGWALDVMPKTVSDQTLDAWQELVLWLSREEYR